MCFRTIVFCLFLFLTVCFICDSEALASDGEGVCVVKLSMRQKRRKPYNAVSNKWCGRKKCIVKRFKIETYLTWTNRTVCCNGWQHNSDLDVCSPICSTGCAGGRCVGPDTCYCEPPAYLDPDLQNNCVTPLCNPSCFNATCHANNTCICNAKFTRHNSTHCFHCDSGYIPDEHLNCQPVCKNCVNSSCVAPNQCKCFEGYTRMNDTVCEPICNCVNSSCVEPGKCSCFEGYAPINDTVCVPKCDNCVNGECVAPNDCSCREGYEKIDGICNAKCSNCENGFCDAPEVCSCYDGYVKTSENVCVKRCNGSCKGYCNDGVCVSWNCSSTPIL